MIIALLVILFFLLLIGTPIYISLILSTFITLMVFTDIDSMVAIQRIFGGIDKFVLMSVPFFILAANAMDVGGLSTRILAFARALVGHFFGGIAMATQTGSMFFGALSGSSPATVVAMGRIMYPELLRQGYPKTFSSGLIIQSGAVSLVIPPSITLILYASATNTSVGSLFLAGLGAGLFFACFILLYIYIYSRTKNFPKSERVSLKEIAHSIKNASWSLMVPVIIVGGISLGIFTPTEAAGVSAMYSIFVGMVIYKEITWKKLYDLCFQSAKTSAQVLILVASASAIGWLMTAGQVPQQLAAFVTETFTSGWTFLLFLNFMLLIIGMFVDSTIALVVIAPLLLTSAISLGIDPIHLGIIMVLNLALGTFTPPFGLNIFVANSITNMKLSEMLPGIFQFLWVSIIALLIITYIPSISTLLPTFVYG
ncbi:TRAP transporter large permease [Bacillus sp. B15-48]|uniref:TRAP transporter large permease n=1 Tax=Bacillus sp. B15-48 TaxID=1548601 RepID=UPI00193FB068|nr:TRAP transporter large permease [Bacillus sp. B15-48]MBM4763632.1 TRAP transporter large permease subunit [Bacillus sp. B15-48]